MDGSCRGSMSADTGKDDQVIQHDAGPAGVVPEPGDSPEPTPPADASATSGSPERRELSFRTSGLSIQLEISGTTDSRRLTGQLIPRQSAVVDIRHSAGVITVEADALGRFSAECIPSGTVSMRCRLSTPISTGWIAFLAQVSPPPDKGDGGWARANGCKNTRQIMARNGPHLVKTGHDHERCLKCLNADFGQNGHERKRVVRRGAWRGRAAKRGWG